MEAAHRFMAGFVPAHPEAWALRARPLAPPTASGSAPWEQAEPSPGVREANKGFPDHGRPLEVRRYAEQSAEDGKEISADKRSGQALPQVTRGAEPDAVAMGCLGMTRWTTVRPGDTVTHIKTWRWAFVESVARGAGGRDEVSVQFSRGDRCTEAAHRFMAGSVPPDPEACEDPGESRIPKMYPPDLQLSSASREQQVLRVLLRLLQAAARRGEALRPGAWPDVPRHPFCRRIIGRSGRQPAGRSGLRPPARGDPLASAGVHW